MFIRDTRKIYRSSIEKAVGENATGKDVLDYIFGTYDNDYNGETDLILESWEEPSHKSVFHRVNMLWVIVLTIILSPIRFILYGQVGWDTKSKFGRWIIKITGNLKE